ncbi:MAG: hypothetical protein AB7Y46_08680 [Armatimonadota bacterium]
MAKRQPWVQVLAYPLGATPVMTRQAFCRTDRLAELAREPNAAPPVPLLPDRTIGGVRLTTPERAIGYGVIEDVDNLYWWDLEDRNENTSVSGYTVAPALIVRANRMTEWALTHGEVRGRRDPMVIEWEDVVGEYWETCTPDAEPQEHAIAWRGTDRNEPYLAVTKYDLPRAQSWSLRLWFLGTAPVYDDQEENLPYLRVLWGGCWSVVFDLYRPPALQRRVNGEWRTVRSFEDLGGDLFASGVPVWLSCMHIAGRIVMVISPAGAERQQVVYTRRQEDAFGVPQVMAVAVPEGPMALEGCGVAFSAQLHEVCWGRWVPEAKDEYGIVTPAHWQGDGRFSRTYNCNRVVSASAQKTAVFGFAGDGSPHGRSQFAEGDAGSVGSVVDEPVRDALGRTTGQRRYTVTLTAHNPDIDDDWMETSGKCMAGATTPFATGVAVRLGSAHTQQSLDPIDLRPALRTVTEELADPALTAGPTWQLAVHRDLLPECIHQGTGNPIGSAWTNYVEKYHVLKVNVAWVQADGSISAGPQPGGSPAPYVQRLNGLISAVQLQTDRFGTWPATIIARDPSLLLQEPAGVIDGRFAPLDLLLLEKLDQGERRLMGWEAVRYILEVALGPDVADSLRAVFPDNQYDLLTHRIMLDPPSGGFFFPPPFGQDAYRWIMQLAERDFAVFFWRADPNDWSQVVPYYANYFAYLKDVPTWELPDAVYAPGDADHLITGFGWQQEPREDYNRVLVWGAPPGQGSLGGLMPALDAFSAEARIETSALPEQAIPNTWERTKVLSGTHYWLPLVARVVAMNLVRLIQGVDVRTTTIKTRGNPYLWWGFRVRPQMGGAASDPYGADLNDRLSRIMRMRNSIDLERGNWETVLRLAPEPENL